MEESILAAYLSLEENEKEEVKALIDFLLSQQLGGLQ